MSNMGEVVDATSRFGAEIETSGDVSGETENVAQTAKDVCDVPDDLMIQLNIAMTLVNDYVERFSQELLGVENPNIDGEIVFQKVEAIRQRYGPNYTKYSNIEIVRDLLQRVDRIKSIQNTQGDSGVTNHLLDNDRQEFEILMTLSSLVMMREIPWYTLPQKEA